MKNLKNKSREEYKNFDSVSDQWWEEDGKFAILHKINPIRIKYILDQISSYKKNKKNPLNKIKIIDFGCGGGLKFRVRSDHGRRTHHDPSPERTAAWRTAFSVGRRVDAGFWHHGLHQSCAWCFLHAWRVYLCHAGVVARFVPARGFACGTHHVWYWGRGGIGHCPAAVSGRSS